LRGVPLSLSQWTSTADCIFRLSNVCENVVQDAEPESIGIVGKHQQNKGLSFRCGKGSVETTGTF